MDFEARRRNPTYALQGREVASGTSLVLGRKGESVKVDLVQYVMAQCGSFFEKLR